VIQVQRFDVDADSQELAEEKASELMDDMFPDLSEITELYTEKHERDPDDARDEQQDQYGGADHD
jgi:hypothetical protein